MDATLKSMNATPHERYLTYLTAYSESRFFNGRSQMMKDGKHFTRGMFQQSDRWWPNPLDIPTATRSFLQAFRDGKVDQLNLSNVAKLWVVQQWAAPDPRIDLVGFIKSPETQNYVNCEVEIIRKKMGEDSLYFTHHPDGIKK